MKGAVLVAWLALIGIQNASAQNYPTRPIRLVVASSPGGGSDILGRMFAQKLTEELGQQVVVDNRGGASGVIGTDIVAKSVPDGYTLLIIAPTLTINPSMMKKVPYDAVRDFAPVSLVVDAAQLLMVNASLPAKGVKDLIALAKAKPGQIIFGSPGFGTLPHVIAEMFKQMAGVDMQQAVFKGSGPAYISLVSGEVSVAFSTVLSAMPHIKTGKIRPLGVTTKKRVAIMPEVPTIMESALPGFESSNWWGILAPAHTPRPIVDRLYDALLRGTTSPDMKERFAAQGVDIVNGKPEEFAALIKREIGQWARVIKAAGIKAE